MKRIIPFATFIFAMGQCSSAWASKTVTYELIQESSYLLITLICLVTAALLFQSLKGGSLGTPWLFFAFSFALAGSDALLRTLDILITSLNQYDFGLAFLLLRSGSALLMLIGLILYKQGLQ